MIEIKITEKSPLDALASLTAFGMYSQSISAVKDAAKCILEQDARKDAHAPNADTPADTSASVSAPTQVGAPQQPAAPASMPAHVPGIVTPQPVILPPAPAQMQMPLNTPQASAPAPQQPMTPPAQVPTAAPVSPPTLAAAPVAAPAAYTLEQLQHAAGELVRTNKQNALMALLTQFNVPSLIQLPKEQYGAFATALRGIGAMI